MPVIANISINGCTARQCHDGERKGETMGKHSRVKKHQFELESQCPPGLLDDEVISYCMPYFSAIDVATTECLKLGGSFQSSPQSLMTGGWPETFPEELPSASISLTTAKD